MINDSFDLEHKTQNKGKVLTKPDMLSGNDHNTTVTQNNLEPVWSKELSTSEDKKTIFILGDSMVKHVERWKLSNNDNRKHKVYVRSFPLAKVKYMRNYIKNSA